MCTYIVACCSSSYMNHRIFLRQSVAARNSVSNVMLSRLEAVLLRSDSRTPGQNPIRKRLFEYLNGGASLRNLRATSRVLRELVSHYSGRMFSALYVKTPLQDAGHVDALIAIVPYCRYLTITVLPTDTAPHRRSWIKETSDAASSVASRARENMPNAEPLPSIADLNKRASMMPGQIPLMQRDGDSMPRKQWGSIFARCGIVQTLTFRVLGDPAWPGRTEIEDTLILLRSTIEHSSLPALREVHLAPIHAMGIIHLRWNSLGSFGTQPPLQSLPPIVWQRLTTLDIQLRSAHPSTRPTAAQNLMALKLLHSYLRSFAPTLKTLRFVYLEQPGPSPLALGEEPLLKDTRQPIDWLRLEELWVGNITFPQRTISLLPLVAPELQRLMMLRSTQRDSCMQLSDAKAWVRIALKTPKPAEERRWEDTTSSVYSQSARSSVTEPVQRERSPKGKGRALPIVGQRITE